MPIRIRLARHGQKHSPVFHLVAINAAKRRDARPLEKLGEYDPIPRVPKELAHFPPKANVFGAKAEQYDVPKEKRIEWNVERIRYWLGVGAEPTRAAVKLLERVSALLNGRVLTCREACSLRRTSGSTSGRLLPPRVLLLRRRPRWRPLRPLPLLRPRLRSRVLGGEGNRRAEERELGGGKGGRGPIYTHHSGVVFLSFFFLHSFASSRGRGEAQLGLHPQQCIV
jgi:small subunit ribosomal protein S16